MATKERQYKKRKKEAQQGKAKDEERTAEMETQTEGRWKIKANVRFSQRRRPMTVVIDDRRGESSLPGIYYVVL